VNDGPVYFFGGACGLLIGIGYAIIIALYAPIGAPPASADALLLYLASNESRWWWIIGLSVLTDLLFIPVVASIWLVLRKVNVYLAGLAAACIILFVFLDLSITWTNYASEMALAGRYTRAVTEAQESAILAAAEPGAAILHSRLLFVYNSLTLAAGILLAGIAMRRSIFSRAAAYLGIATGCVGILAVAGAFFTNAVNAAIIAASCLTTIWVFVLGYELCRCGRVFAARNPG